MRDSETYIRQQEKSEEVGECVWEVLVLFQRSPDLTVKIIKCV